MLQEWRSVGKDPFLDKKGPEGRLKKARQMAADVYIVRISAV